MGLDGRRGFRVLVRRDENEIESITTTTRDLSTLYFFLCCSICFKGSYDMR